MVRFVKIMLLISLIITAFALSGCVGSSKAYTTPPEGLSLEDAGKIDLKILDMGKLTKSRIQEVSGISLENYGEGYDIKYRYLNSTITFQIVKFGSPSKGDKFWDKWVSNGGYQETMENGVSVVSLQTKLYSVRAWQKGSWFTYIGVPTEISNHQELINQITQYVNYYYDEL